MKILLVAASYLEVEPIIIKKPTDVEVLITGIGMVATAFAMGRRLAMERFDLAINAGIAGAYTRRLKIGQVVNVVSDVLSEMGAEDGEKFIPFHKLDIEKLSESYSEDGIICNKTITENKKINELEKVNAVSVNTIHGREESIKREIDNYNPDIETMEGAAFMYACQKMNLEYFQLRAVSNYVEKRNTESWDIRLAVSNLNKTLRDIFVHFI